MNANYSSRSGSSMNVRDKGKGFEVVINFPASKHSAAERKVINCKAWSGVEKKIKKWNMVEVE